MPQGMAGLGGLGGLGGLSGLSGTGGAGNNTGPGAGLNMPQGGGLPDFSSLLGQMNNSTAQQNSNQPPEERFKEQVILLI